jgi:hypothetical protein
MGWASLGVALGGETIRVGPSATDLQAWAHALEGPLERSGQVLLAAARSRACRPRSAVTCGWVWVRLNHRHFGVPVAGFVDHFDPAGGLDDERRP